MNSIVTEASKALEDLSSQIINVFGDSGTLVENWGWNTPALTGSDMASLPKLLVKKLKSLDESILDEEALHTLRQIPHRVSLYRDHTLPNTPGNGMNGITPFFQLLDWIRISLDSYFIWVPTDNKLLPNALNKRLRSVQVELDNLIPEKEELKNQIDLIATATATAEALPADIESLNEARKKVEKHSESVAALFAKTSNSYEEIEKNRLSIQATLSEATGIMGQIEEAYRVTTTKGLAAAFEQRARSLNSSMWIWVLGLIGALTLGALISANRFEQIRSNVTEVNPNWGLIWVNIVLAILSVGGPLWLAWIATKQISQRFRLAEDYGFKASVAKAYEGYRKEAARLDIAFEARLFSSALTRLEEAPLRLMENETHGSPWHELVSSPQFQKAMNQVPELKDKFVGIVKNAVDNVTSKKSSKAETETKATEGE